MWKNSDQANWNNNIYRWLFFTLMGPCTEVFTSSLDFSHLMSCSMLCLMVLLALRKAFALLLPISSLLKCCRIFIFTNSVCGFLIVPSISICHRNSFSPQAAVLEMSIIPCHSPLYKLTYKPPWKKENKKKGPSF